MNRIVITRCDIINAEVKATEEQWEARISPAAYDHSHLINYTDRDSGGNDNQNTGMPVNPSISKLRFATVIDETVSFILVVSGMPPLNRVKGEVPEQIASLEKIVSSYNEREHLSSVVKINWGEATRLLFYGRLKSMGVIYTVFDLSGLPLRATINLSFSRYVGNTDKP